MVRIIGTLLCLALASAPGPAAAQSSTQRLTLDDAVALAVRENRTLRAKEFEYLATKDVSTTVVITAPRSGVIVERNVTPGQVVAYGQSDTPASLFVIADLGTLWVLFAFVFMDLRGIPANLLSLGAIGSGRSRKCAW